MHWFLDPITKHYADFNGRAGRQEYWMFILIWILISIAFGVVVEFVSVVSVLHIIVSLGILIPSIALAARRLHDSGKSGWWQLVALIPFVGIIILIVLMVLPSDEGENQYGPHPGAATMAAIPPAAPQPAAEVAPEQSDSHNSQV